MLTTEEIIDAAIAAIEREDDGVGSHAGYWCQILNYEHPHVSRSYHSALQIWFEVNEGEYRYRVETVHDESGTLEDVFAVDISKERLIEILRKGVSVGIPIYDREGTAIN
jgi:hypothetical protein